MRLLKCLIILVIGIAINLYSNNVYANTMKSSITTIGIVLIGDNDFRTNPFYEIIDKKLQLVDKGDVSKVIVYGDEIQNKYQQYWLEKGFLEEQNVTKNDLVDFVKYSGNDKVMYLLINNSNISQNSRIQTKPNNKIKLQTWTNLTIETRVFLVDNSDVLKFSSIIGRNEHVDEVLAKKAIFRKCLEEINKQFKKTI